MEETNGFYDFCIPHNEDDRILREMCRELVDMGYRTIALEQQFDHTKKENIKRSMDIFPQPHNIKSLQDEFKNKLKILQRLTIIYDEINVAHAMANSLNIKKFNVIAGQPKTEAALTVNYNIVQVLDNDNTALLFQHCCTTFNGDIISFNPQDGARFFVSRKAYQVGVKRGIYFEIKYSWCITNSNYRKDIIKIAHNYFARGKSRNIILSSGAANVFELRSPYDVANMSFIFSLSEDQGKCAIDRYGRLLFLRAASRRLGKTIMFVKAAGPVVFSHSSSDDSEMEEDDIRLSETESQNYDIPAKKIKIA